MTSHRRRYNVIFAPNARWEYFISFLSEEQRLKMVHKEYLEVYIHHQAQMAEMSKTLSSEVNELVRDMVVNFEDSNPYLVRFIT